jgi:hypothetical protein
MSPDPASTGPASTGPAVLARAPGHPLAEQAAAERRAQAALLRERAGQQAR